MYRSFRQQIHAGSKCFSFDYNVNKCLSPPPYVCQPTQFLGRSSVACYFSACMAFAGHYSLCKCNLLFGEKFTKLDMSQAYQQLKLDEESKKFTTINTHKGYFNIIGYNLGSHHHLESSNALSKIYCKAHVIVRMDDILVSGEDDVKHLENLNEVLTRLSQAGLRLRQEKCCFMQLEVVYCGHTINEEGVLLWQPRLML